MGNSVLLTVIQADISVMILNNDLTRQKGSKGIKNMCAISIKLIIDRG